MRLGASLESLVGRAVNAAHPDAFEQTLATALSAATRFRLSIIELPVDAAIIYPTLFTAQAVARLRHAAAADGLSFTVHLPFWWADISSVDEFVRVASVHSTVRGIERCQPLEPLAYIVHPWGNRLAAVADSTMTAEERSLFIGKMLDSARRSLAELKAATVPRELCVENIEGLPFHHVAALAQGMGLRLCFDIGHALVMGEEPLSLVAGHLDDIAIIHLHDVATREGRRRDHQPLGAGIPLPELWHTLRHRGWEGLVILEMDRPEYLAESIGRLQGLGLID